MITEKKYAYQAFTKTVHSNEVHIFFLANLNSSPSWTSHSEVSCHHNPFMLCLEYLCNIYSLNMVRLTLLKMVHSAICQACVPWRPATGKSISGIQTYLYYGRTFQILFVACHLLVHLVKHTQSKICGASHRWE